MKPRIKRAMLPRKGAYSVYVNEKCLPYESLHHFTVQEQFQCALWNPSQYVALLTLQQDQLGVSTLGHRKRLSGRSRRQALLPDQRRACSGITPILSMRLSAAVSVGQGGSAPADEIADGNRSMLSEGAKAARLIREDSHFLPREFERWIYYDVDMRFSLPFVIRVPRNSDGQSLPLLIFLHGAGGGGRSCVKPVTASFSMQWALARAGKRGECILLIHRCRRLISGIRKIMTITVFTAFPASGTGCGRFCLNDINRAETGLSHWHFSGWAGLLESAVSTPGSLCGCHSADGG